MPVSGSTSYSASLAMSRRWFSVTYELVLEPLTDCPSPTHTDSISRGVAARSARARRRPGCCCNGRAVVGVGLPAFAQTSSVGRCTRGYSGK
jgi:hypothetical protein